MSLFFISLIFVCLSGLVWMVIFASAEHFMKTLFFERVEELAKNGDLNEDDISFLEKMSFLIEDKEGVKITYDIINDIDAKRPHVKTKDHNLSDCIYGPAFIFMLASLLSRPFASIPSLIRLYNIIKRTKSKVIVNKYEAEFLNANLNKCAA